MLKKYFYTLLGICCFCLTVAGQNHATGLIFDDEAYQKTPLLSHGLGFTAEAIPEKYSLRPYCPTVGNQGQMGSCTGWAVGYTAMTITIAKERDITDQATIDAIARSPLFLYNQIKDLKSNCKDGIAIENALNFIKEKGIPAYSEFNPSDCRILPSSSVLAQAARFRIGESNRLFEIEETNAQKKIDETIAILKEGRPVIIGMICAQSFQDFHRLRTENEDIYIPLRHDIDSLGGHALCVIGYDKTTKTFEIMNSWGNDRKKGFFRMRFEDYGSPLVRRAYIIGPRPSQAVTLSGELALTMKGAASPLPLLFDKTTQTYSTEDGIIPYRAKFSIAANGMSKNTYLYVFSLSEEKTKLLFPVETGEILGSPLIPANNSFWAFPTKQDDATQQEYITATTPGKDALCLLYSSQPIDNIKAYLTEFEQKKGSIQQRLEAVFGKALLPAENIDYNSSKMKFSAEVGADHNINENYIVPFVFSVEVY
jgi:Papain family cysteine protease